MGQQPAPLIARMTTSERSEFGRCPQAWWWKYREGLQPKETANDARWFGTGVHIALAQWYRPGKERGLRPSVAFADWMLSQQSNFISTVIDGEQKYQAAYDLGVAMLESYYERFGTDEKWDFIATEQFGEALIEQIEKSPVPLALYSFTFDGVFRDVWGDIWLLENKTAKQIRTLHLPIDDQAGSYWLFAEPILRSMGILKRGQALSGIMYNFLRKAMPDERARNDAGSYLNLNGSVSKQQPSPFFHREAVERTLGQRRSILRNIQMQADTMLGMRNGEIYITKTKTRDCPFCDFFEMCELNEDQGNPAWEDFRDATYRPSDPYAYQHKDAGA